jgi:hypothetical protein
VLEVRNNKIFNNYIIALTSFIEKSYISKVQLLDNYGLKSYVDNSNKVTDISTRPISIQDLDISFAILSPKNFVDIVSKDFAKSYDETVKVYQNDMGFFDQALKVFKSKGDHRVFIQYNELESVESTQLVKVLKPIPIEFKVTSDMGTKLQSAFNVAKSLIIPKIYRNNYVKHCINKIHFEGEEVNEAKSENETKIDLCVIALEHKDDTVDDKLNKAFYKVLINNFNKHMNKFSQKLKKSKDQEEYNININFGTTNLEKNPDLKAMYNKYILDKNINDAVLKKKSKLFLVINHTNEKFVFKWFDDDKQMTDFFTSVDNSDYFEDISLGVNYNLVIFYFSLTTLLSIQLEKFQCYSMNIKTIQSLEYFGNL